MQCCPQASRRSGMCNKNKSGQDAAVRRSTRSGTDQRTSCNDTSPDDCSGKRPASAEPALPPRCDQPRSGRGKQRVTEAAAESTEDSSAAQLSPLWAARVTRPKRSASAALQDVLRRAAAPLNRALPDDLWTMNGVLIRASIEDSECRRAAEAKQKRLNTGPTESRQQRA